MLNIKLMESKPPMSQMQQIQQIVLMQQTVLNLQMELIPLTEQMRRM